MENLKGCGVDQDTRFDRKSESYDFNLKYRLNGENSLKRRQSYSDDSDKGVNSSSGFDTRNKRFRASSLSVKNARSHLTEDRGSKERGMNEPRVILDLSLTAECTDDDVAKEIANKLYEEKDDLMCKWAH